MWYDERHNTFLVALKEGAPPTAQLDAWFHAVWCAAAGTPPGNPQKGAAALRDWMRDSLRDLLAFREELGLYALLADRGWDLDTPALEVRAGTRLAASF